MVAPRHRSRSKKRVKVRVPGGKTATRFKGKTPAKAHCARCAAPLGGVENRRTVEQGKLSKSQKRPTRPFAGTLCQTCTERLVRYTTLFEVKASFDDYAGLPLHRDLTLEKYLPRGWWASLNIKEAEPEPEEEEVRIIEEPLEEEAGAREEKAAEEPPEKDPLEVMKLSELKGIGPKLEEELHVAGITSLAKLLAADPEELAERVSGASADRLASFQDQTRKLAKQLK